MLFEVKPEVNPIQARSITIRFPAHHLESKALVKTQTVLAGVHDDCIGSSLLCRIQALRKKKPTNALVMDITANYTPCQFSDIFFYCKTKSDKQT
ncbi:hypothetical protein [Oligoflexus sp.]|uniref:hypothetical protein n=1 Tax=Oligoflexus sp. TaxID=1971216 RepID=UPI002D7E4982|nr:hypothetical protein [Oligoflexus sp.]